MRRRTRKIFIFVVRIRKINFSESCAAHEPHSAPILRKFSQERYNATNLYESKPAIFLKAADSVR